MTSTRQSHADVPGADVPGADVSGADGSGAGVPGADGFGPGTPTVADHRWSRPAPTVVRSPLPDPPADAEELAFDACSLPRVRASVAEWAAQTLSPTAACDIVLAVHEVASNSVRHGGGRGVLRCWRDGSSFVCEVRDAGHIERDLTGWEMPPVEGEFGRGLWLANQLCDLVQLRSGAGGTVIRLRLAAD